MTPNFFVLNINEYVRIRFKDIYVGKRNPFFKTPAFKFYQDASLAGKEVFLKGLLLRSLANLKYSSSLKIKKWREIDGDQDYIRCKIKDSFYDYGNNLNLSLTIEFEIIHSNGLFYLLIKAIKI